MEGDLVSKKFKITIATVDMNEHVFVRPIESRNRFFISLYTDKVLDVSNLGHEKYIFTEKIVSIDFEEFEEEDDK